MYACGWNSEVMVMSLMAFFSFWVALRSLIDKRRTRLRLRTHRIGRLSRNGLSLPAKLTTNSTLCIASLPQPGGGCLGKADPLGGLSWSYAARFELPLGSPPGGGGLQRDVLAIRLDSCADLSSPGRNENDGSIRVSPGSPFQCWNTTKE